MQRSFAFFDLDGTIINIKTMLSFFEFCVYKGVVSKDSYEALITLFAGGEARELINKAYYKIYQGLDVDDLNVMGDEWFAGLAKNSKLLFVESILEEIDFHKKNNTEIVLVSGSFMPCVQPIAKYLQIDRLLLTNLEIKENKFTGELVDGPNIGDGKVKSILDFISEYNCDLANCYAYGDHESDLPMLKLVGFPCLVNANDALIDIAKNLNMRLI